ncbi:hypothetical protein [Actinoallomurus acanthiterrae]
MAGSTGLSPSARYRVNFQFGLNVAGQSSESASVTGFSPAEIRRDEKEPAPVEAQLLIDRMICLEHRGSPAHGRGETAQERADSPFSEQPGSQHPIGVTRRHSPNAFAAEIRPDPENTPEKAIPTK